MKQYSGRVIGGAHAGEYHAVRGEILQLPIPFDVTSIAPIGPAEIPTEFVKDTVATYRHQSMWWVNRETGNDRQFHFWVPWEVKDPQPFILETLIQGYVENANRKDRRR